MKTPNTANTTLESLLGIGDQTNGSTWGVTTGDLPETTPGNFSFTNQVDVDEDALVVKELSKFELQCREKAQQRQKDRLATGTPQSVAGKTLKSSAFVSEPSTIEYIDFTPGVRHVLNIKLTNGS